MLLKLKQLLIILLIKININTCEVPPNIFIILADDLGWNDVSFHGSNQIQTPNIDTLGYNGIILNSHYVQPSDTSTRIALLTGKYPFHMGYQGKSIQPGEVRDLPNIKMMPEYFKDIGYTTYLIGKWHLGYSKWNDTPTSRGFDHFYGTYNGYTGYYDYVTSLKLDDMEYNGFDLRKNKDPSWEDAGTYATDLFTQHAIKLINNHSNDSPIFMILSHLAVHAGNEGKQLEAPQETINQFNYILNPHRRTLAGMISELDKNVGKLMEALSSNNLLQNSIVLFLSDNGAPSIGKFKNWGSNYPLRGLKGSLFEGSVRGVACLYSPLLIQSSRVSTDLMHITDWLPTLFSAANGDINLLDPDIDGIDQWSSLMYDLPSPRNDILLNINEISRSAAIRFYNWKLIVGGEAENISNGYIGDSGKKNLKEIDYNFTALSTCPTMKSIRKLPSLPPSELEMIDLRNIATIKCNSNNNNRKNVCNFTYDTICLYDIPNDPCEENNLTNFFPSVVRRMKRALVEYRKALIEQVESMIDITNANPELFKFTWNPWLS